MIDTVRRFFDEAGLDGTCGVVAVSGGPDSVALAHAVVHLLRQGVLGDVVLAHVNHQLRGLESDEDEAFVAGLRDSWAGEPKLRCRTTRKDVAAMAQLRGDNLEQTGRDLRYEWLADVARQEGAAWLAVGHSADDQAETVLHRLLRGSGLQGLTAMARRRPLAEGVELVRPLLDVRRADILAYLHQHGQPFRRDSSNLDEKFTRNRLRLQLLPMLADQYQPAMVDVLCRLADQAQAVQAEMTELARVLLSKAELPRAGALLVFAVSPLTAASPHLVCEMFRRVWRHKNWPMNAMDHQAWLRLVDVLHGRVVQCDFPRFIRARRRDNVMQVGPAA